MPKGLMHIFNVSLYTDNEKPVISNCPADVMVNTTSGQSYAPATWTEPTATDNSGSVTLTSNKNNGDNFNIGTTQVTYIAADEAGNTRFCRFDVIVSGITKDSRITRQESAQKMWGHALVYMKIEKGAKGR